MANKLMERVMKASTLKTTNVLKDSDLFTIDEFVTLPIPAMNLAMSGRLDGGLFQGLHIVAGESRSFKTLFGLIMMKSYLDAYPDAIGIFLDSEFGAAQGYFESVGIDTTRVAHIPVHNIEELTFETVAQLEQIQRGDKVFLFVDSVGNLASKREVQNAINQNEAKDMSRPQALKGFWRIVTPYLNTRKIPMVAIQHVYKEQGSMYPATVVSGGQGGILSANTIWIISKRQNKDDGELLGFDFTINVDKGRLAKEKSQIPITVSFEGGVSKYSGLFEIAREGGFIKDASRKGYYKRVIADLSTGEIKDDVDWTKKTANSDEFWKDLLSYQPFIDHCKTAYSISNGRILGD